MHETVIARSLLRIVLEELARHQEGGPLQVTEITVQAGLLSGIEPVTLEGCFSLLAEGTAAEGADLRVQTEPVRGRCPDCGKDVATHKRRFSCPECGGDCVDWHGGNEMFIAAMKVLPAAPGAA